MSWYPQGLSTTAVPALEQVIAKMSLLRKDERQRLHAELLAREGMVWSVAVDSGYYGEQFNDFRDRVTWRQPRGLYSIRVGDDAKVQSSNGMLDVQAPLLGVYARLDVFIGGGDRSSEYHEDIAATLSGRHDKGTVIDGVDVHSSFGSAVEGGLKLRYGVTSANHRGNAVVMTAWGAEGSPTLPGAIQDVLDGLGLPATLPETSAKDGRFTDHHYGVSVAVGSGWSRLDLTPPDLTAGRVTQWKKGGAELVLVVAAAPGLSDAEAWVTSFVEQTIRESLALTSPLGKPKSSKGTLDGYPSRRLVYSTVQAEVVVRNSVLCLLVMSNVNDSEAERFRGSVRWRR